MRRSKARDISQHKPLVTALKAGSPLVVEVPPDSKRHKPLKIDFSEASSLGRLANEMVGLLVESITGLASPTAQLRYNVVRRFAVSLTNSTSSPPTDWSHINWDITTNDWIKRRQTSGVADGTANTDRTNIHSFFKAVWRAGKVPEFTIVPGIRSPVSNKKADVGSIPQSRPFDYSKMTKDQAAIARRLEELTDISDPEVHRERVTLILQVLEDHASSETRRHWAEFDEVRGFLEDEAGLDVDRFLSAYRITRAPLRFRRGWQKRLRNKRDRMRFLCHAEIYNDAILSPDENCVKKWLSEEGYSARDVCNGLHPTISNVMPIMTLVIMELNLEESSAVSITPDCCTQTDGEKSVSIRWTKGRSGEMQSEIRPKGTVSSLHPQSTEPIAAFQALSFLNDLRVRLEHALPPEDANAAFIVCNQFHRGRSVVGRINEAELSRFFRRFLKRNPILEVFSFTPDKIRGSGVLKVHLTFRDILATAKAARHKSLETTKKYIDTISGHHVERAQIREVQDLLLANSLPAHSELRPRLGLDEKRIKQIAEQTSRSGFLEWFPTPGVKRKPKAKDKRSHFMEMLLSGQHVILEDPEVAAELFAYRQHLIDQAPVLRDTADWWDLWAPAILYFTKSLEVIRPDIRLAGEKLAADHQIEYMEDF
ncbi:hypothetical protein [Rhizobium leguminosarum]|uniref:hypothetical protein n=1 Tax=Rhizobium leguminosarum TaxID=384 RepID=UPI002FF050BC